ncbi:MAG TPA: FAD-dependent oxidoreductase, partial [Calditerricola sp.]
MPEKFDVIVVGAGPAGTSCAYVLAKAGVNVLLIERGEYPGAKNVMGGVLYRKMMEDLIPGFYKEAPLERPVVEQRFMFLDKESAVT